MENDNKKENEQKQKKKHSKLCSKINNIKKEYLIEEKNDNELNMNKNKNNMFEKLNTINNLKFNICKYFY